MIAIKFNDINLQFGNKIILKDLNFEINKNEFISFFGQSGTGKTSILKLISGIYKPTSGKIEIFNTDRSVNQINQRIATIWQNKALFPHLNVKNNIKFGLSYLDISDSEKKQRFDNMVDILNIKHMLNRSIKQLSGGEQQKVSIARALIIRPNILLLDEPFNGIDELFRENFREELGDLLREYDTTFVLVSHDINDILAFSDRIGILEGRNLIQIGTPADIIQHPKSVFIAKSIGEYNVVKSENISVNSNSVTVLTTLGTFEIATNQKFSPNEKLHVLISPLDVKICEKQDNNYAIIKRIEQTASKLEVVIEKGNLKVFRVLIQQSNKLPDFIRKGNKVGLQFNQSKMLILKEH